MRKTALLMGLVVVSAVAGGSFAYGWHSVTNEINVQQATAETSVDPSPVPSESKGQSSTQQRTQPLNAGTSRQSIQDQLAQAYGQVSVTLDEPQLNQLIDEAIRSQPQAAQLLINAESLQTTLTENLIETGAILNLSELPRENLSAEIQTGLDQLVSAAPMLANRDIYIGLLARPQVRSGQITLDQDLSLKLGQFTLPMNEVGAQMGFSMKSVEQHLNDILNQQGLSLETIEILDNQLVITGIRS